MAKWLLPLLILSSVFADTVIVQKGDNLTTVLRKAKHSTKEIHSWIYDSKLPEKLGDIEPGDEFKFTRNDQNIQITYHSNRGKLVKFIRLKDGKLVVDTPNDAKPAKRFFKSFNIRRSLTVDGKRAGLTYNVLQSLADIYAWEVDFTKDLKKGDRIQLIYEQKQLSDGYWGEQEIVYAKIIQTAKSREAIRYIDEDNHIGYYNSQGQSLTRSFMRVPIEYTRISSPFSLHRQHPVFGSSRPHSGVDLAAKRGTPVYATSAGKVVFRGRKGGYGKAIIIKHGSRVTTLYAHLDRFARNITRGTSVTGKQLIGYVGSTGVATGPHIHYEFRIDNDPKDPMAIHLPRSRPLVGMSYLRMLAERQQWLSMAVKHNDHI